MNHQILIDPSFLLHGVILRVGRASLGLKILDLFLLRYEKGQEAPELHQLVYEGRGSDSGRLSTIVIHPLCTLVKDGLKSGILRK